MRGWALSFQGWSWYHLISPKYFFFLFLFFPMTIEWISSLVTPGEKLGLWYVSTASSCSLSLEPSSSQKCQLWSLLHPLTWSETHPQVGVLGDFPELPGLDEYISLSRLHSKTHNLGYITPQTYFFTILEKSGEGSLFGLLIDSHLFDMSLLKSSHTQDII